MSLTPPEKDFDHLDTGIIAFELPNKRVIITNWSMLEDLLLKENFESIKVANGELTFEVCKTSTGLILQHDSQIIGSFDALIGILDSANVTKFQGRYIFDG